MGDLVFAPLVLALVAARAPRGLARLVELGVLAAALVYVSIAAFGLVSSVGGHEFPQSYAVFPLLAWAALRFGPRGAAGANFAVSVISVAATVNGTGPFARPTLNESLFQLQTFMACGTLTSLVLGAAVAERDRAIALRDDFLALASHELQTPLAAVELDVASLARMIARRDAPEEKLRHRVAHTEHQVDRLRELVSRLLDSSQIAAGGLTLVPMPIDLVVVAREVVERFTPALGDAAALSLDAPASVRGEWDAVRVELVLQNLVSNAVKYGEGKPIQVSVTGTSREATMIVRDHGIGIPADQKAVIFDRFERAVSSQSYPGLGLGLWIAKSIVDAMGGRILVESQPGAGTTFTVTLPRG
jgi:signal transduction histidine kinase